MSGRLLLDSAYSEVERDRASGASWVDRGGFAEGLLVIRRAPSACMHAQKHAGLGGRLRARSEVGVVEGRCRLVADKGGL